MTQGTSSCLLPHHMPTHADAVASSIAMSRGPPRKEHPGAHPRAREAAVLLKVDAELYTPRAFSDASGFVLFTCQTAESTRSRISESPVATERKRG